MQNKVISMPDIFKDAPLALLNSFQNEHYIEESENIELKIPFSDKAYQIPMLSFISFIGLGLAHIDEALTYYRQRIFNDYPWLDEMLYVGLREIFFDIQASLILRNTESLAENGKLYVDCFIIHGYVSEAFLQLKIIEQGTEFEYSEYNDKLIEFNKNKQVDKSYIYEHKNLSSTPEAYLIGPDGLFFKKSSGGLGLTIIDSLSDGDYAIGNIELNKGHYGKLILFRLENKDHIAYNAFSKHVLNSIKGYQNKKIMISSSKKEFMMIHNVGLTNEHRKKLKYFLNDQKAYPAWINAPDIKMDNYFNLLLLNVQRSAIQNAYNNFFLKKVNVLLPFVTVSFVENEERYQVQIIENNNMFFLFNHIQKINALLNDNKLEDKNFILERKKFYLKSLEILYEKDRILPYFDPELAKMLEDLEQLKDIKLKVHDIYFMNNKNNQAIKEIAGKVYSLEYLKNRD